MPYSLIEEHYGLGVSRENPQVGRVSFHYFLLLLAEIKTYPKKKVSKMKNVF